MEDSVKKIVYILGPTTMDGSAISFKAIIDEMYTKNCQIIVMISSKDRNHDFVNHLINKGCSIEIFDDEMFVYPKYSFLRWQHSFIKFPWRLLRTLYRINIGNKQVLEIITKHKPDIVHTNVGVFTQGYKACKKLNIPHLWHIREYQDKDFGWKILPSKNSFKRKLKTSNVITITKDILYHFELQYSKKAQALWNGILPANRATYKQIKQPYFLCANRISPEKDLESAITAFSAVANQIPNMRLMIVGMIRNQVYFHRLKSLAESLGYGDRIEFYDYREDIITLMENATALIVSSKFEGLGRMTLEASFAGCLVLGRNTGGTKEILDETNGGFLFDTTEQLSNLMRSISSMPESIYKDKVLAAQQIVVKRCSNESYAESIYNLYINIIRNHNKEF